MHTTCFVVFSKFLVIFGDAWEEIVLNSNIKFGNATSSYERTMVIFSKQVSVSPNHPSPPKKKSKFSIAKCSEMACYQKSPSAIPKQHYCSWSGFKKDHPLKNCFGKIR